MLHVFLDDGRKLRSMRDNTMLQDGWQNESKAAPERNLVEVDPVLLLTEKRRLLLVRKPA